MIIFMHQSHQDYPIHQSSYDNIIIKSHDNDNNDNDNDNAAISSRLSYSSKFLSWYHNQIMIW